ncbi:unnamed protein product [Closterium sp. NIES-54]
MDTGGANAGGADSGGNGCGGADSGGLGSGGAGTGGAGSGGVASEGGAGGAGSEGTGSGVTACCVMLPYAFTPVGPPHASAAVFPVARLGRVAIFVLSRARVARDIFSARRAPRGTRRCPARRAPRGTRRCPKLPVACPLVRDGALSRRGSAPGARDSVLSHRGPAPGARGGAPASPAPALAAAAPAPPSACPWSCRPRYCTRCSRLCLTPCLHSLQPPLTYPRRPSVAALRLSPRPPPPPSSPCSRGG